MRIRAAAGPLSALEALARRCCGAVLLLSLIVSASLAAATSSEGETPEDKAQLKRDMELMIMLRKSQELSAQKVHEAYEAERAKNEAAVLAARDSENQFVIEETEAEAAKNAAIPPAQRSFDTTEVAVGSSALAVIAVLAIYFLLSNTTFRKRVAELEAARAVLANTGDSAKLAEAANLLDQRVESAGSGRQPDAAPAEGEPVPVGAPAAATAEPAIKRPKIGEVLIHMGHLLPDQMEKALKGAKAHHEKLGRYLLHTGMVTPEILCRALAMQSGLPIADLSKGDIPLKLTKKFTHAVMRANEFIPFKEARTVVCIAAANPLKHKLVEEFEAVCKKKIEVYLAEEDAILMLLDRIHRQQDPKLRRHSRFEVSVPVMFMFCNRMGAPVDHEEHEGLTLNLSEGGMLIEAPGTITFPKDAHGIFVDAIVSNGENEETESIQAICQVRSKRKKQMPENATFNWLMGLELVEIAPEDQFRLKELCSSRAPVG